MGAELLPEEPLRLRFNTHQDALDFADKRVENAKRGFPLERPISSNDHVKLETELTSYFDVSIRTNGKEIEATIVRVPSSGSNLTLGARA